MQGTELHAINMKYGHHINEVLFVALTNAYLEMHGMV